jgi:translocation and assembly module TamB
MEQRTDQNPSPPAPTPPKGESRRSPLLALWRATVGSVKGLAWLGIWLPGALVALLLATLLIGWWWSATPGSLAQALGWAQQWTQEQPAESGRLQVSGVEGTLSEGGQIARLQWNQPGLEVEASAVRVRWSAALLLNLLRGQGVQVQELAIGQLRVNDQRPSTPTEPLQSLTLPVKLHVPWSLDRLVMEGNSALTLSQLRGLYRYGPIDTDSPPSQGLAPGVDAAHQITLDSLQLAQGQYQLQAVLGAEAPMPLKLSGQGQVQATVPGGQSLTLQATADVTGTLASASATLQATARVLPLPGSNPTSARPTLVATATIHPWATDLTQLITQADARAHQLNLALLWPQAPLTDLSGTVSAQPKDGAWVASASLSNSASGPWDQQRLPFNQIDAELEQRDQRWVVPRLTARIGRSELVAKGSFLPPQDNAQARWEGALKASALNPALLWSTLDAMALDASATASTVADRAGAIDLNANIVPSAGQATPALRGLRLREARVKGQWQGEAGRSGALDLQEALLDAAGLRITAKGRADVATFAFNGQAALTLPGAKASLNGEVAHDKGRGDVSLDVDDAARVLGWARSLQTLPMVGPAIADWLRQQPAINQLQLAGNARLSAQWQGGLGELGFPGPANAPGTPPAPLKLDVALDVPRLEGRLPSATPATGIPAAASQATPWSLRQLRFSANGSLAALALKLKGEAAFAPWSGVLDTQAQLKNLPMASQVATATSSLDITALELQLKDASDAKRPVTWQVRSEKPVSLNWNSTPATGLNLQAGVGQLLVQPTFPASTSTTATPRATAPLTLAWEQLKWQGGSLETRGRLQGLPLSWVDSLARAPGETLGPMGRAGVQGDMVFDGEWDVALPGPAGGGAPLRLNAQLQRSSGDLSVQTDGAGSSNASGGTNTTRQPLQAGVREARLNITAQGSQVKASLRWASERLGLASADFSTEIGTGTASDRTASALDRWWPVRSPLSGTLSAELPQVGVWSALAPPGWRMRGTLKAEASLSGTRGAPQWRGTLQAEQLALRSVVDGFEFSNGQLRASIEGERLSIDRLHLEGPSGSEPGGSLDATGSAEWQTPSPGAAREPLIKLEVNANKLRVSTRPDRRLTLSGQVKADLAGPNLKVRGKLTADSALFILPDELAPTLGPDVIVRGGRSLPQGTATAVQVVPDVDVQIDLGPQFDVSGQGLKTRLSGQLTVRQTPTDFGPRVLGEVRTVKGTYRAYGQQLSIETGVLRFTGPYDDPTLDITAVRPKIGEASQRVGVQISGSAQSPRVRLFSDPELPDSEKLAWLVLGRPATGAGAEAAILQQAALALLAGRSGGALDGGLAGALGLDEIGVRGETTNADGSNNAAAFTLGKQVSNKLYLSYERTLAGTLGTVSMFYDFSRRVTLRGRAGEENAIDLIFTLTYD